MDDFLVYRANIEQHNARFEKVLHHIELVVLKLN